MLSKCTTTSRSSRYPQTDRALKVSLWPYSWIESIVHFDIYTVTLSVLREGCHCPMSKHLNSYIHANNGFLPAANL